MMLSVALFKSKERFSSFGEKLKDYGVECTIERRSPHAVAMSHSTRKLHTPRSKAESPAFSGHTASGGLPRQGARLPQSDATHPGSWTLGLHLATLVAAVLATFANTLGNGFHLDDFYRVVDNPGIHRVWPIWIHFLNPGTMATLDRITQFRPLLPLTLSLNYAVAGDSLVGYHLANLAIHLGSTLLVYALSVELLRHWRAETKAAHSPERVAWFVALLYGVHPVSGIPVNYICARDLLLMQFFFLGSWLAFVRLRRTGETSASWACVLVLFALALLSKTGSIVAPLLVLLFEWTLGRQSLREVRPYVRAAAFGLVGVAFLAYSRLVLGFSDLANVIKEGGSPMTYALTQAKLHLTHYLRNFVWPLPIRQSPLAVQATSVFEPAVALALTFIIATLVFAFRWRRTHPLAAFSIGAYWILMLPESSVLPFYHLAVDYRPYPSSPFLFLLVSMASLAWLPRRMTTALASIVVVLMASASVYLNTTWRTEETLWSYSLKYGGDSLAHLNLAMSISDRSDPRVRFHLEEALRMTPDYVLAHIDLGLLQIQQGQREAGLAHCRRAVELRPDWPQAHYWLSRALSQTGNAGAAADEAVLAARMAPAHIMYLMWAALNEQGRKHYRESLAYLARVEAIDPSQDTQFMKGFALQMTGDRAGAIRTYLQLVASQPRHVQGHFNLAFALMEDGRFSEAIAHFERTLALKPDYAEARQHLATCRAKLAE